MKDISVKVGMVMRCGNQGLVVWVKVSKIVLTLHGVSYGSH